MSVHLKSYISIQVSKILFLIQILPVTRLQRALNSAKPDNLTQWHNILSSSKDVQVRIMFPLFILSPSIHA